jgi:hypothetical protein
VSYPRFTYDLLTAYKTLAPRQLRSEVLTPIVTVYAELYAKHTRYPFTRADYLRYLEACITSLVNTTKHSHPVCLDPDSTETFSYESCVIGPEHLNLHELRRPFLGPRLPDMFAVDCYPPFEITHKLYSDVEPPLPDDATDAAKRAYKRRANSFYERQEKQHNKIAEKAFSTVTDLQRPFLGTPLYTFANRIVSYPIVKLPFSVPLERRFGAHYIVAPSGHGKTTLLTAMLLEDIARVLSNELSVVVMDPKGELTDIIKRLAILADTDKLVVIEPEDHIAINPFDIDAGSIQQNAEEIAYLFTSFAEELSGQQDTVLRACIAALLTGYPNPTLDTLHRLLVPDGLKLERNGTITGEFADFARNHPDPERRRFLLQEFLPDNSYATTRAAVVRRMRMLRENEVIRHWFTCSKTKFNIRKQIDACKVIVINNSRDVLSPDGAEFFGRYFISQIRAAGERRKSNDPANVPTFVYVDECDQVIKTDHNIETYVDKLRSKRIGVVLAHQRLAHFLDNQQTLDALLNAPIRFASVDGDADALVKAMRVEDPAQLQFTTPGTEGMFATFIARHSPQTAVIRVKKPELQFMTDAQHAAIRAKMRDLYGRKPEDQGIVQPPLLLPPPTPERKPPPKPQEARKLLPPPAKKTKPTPPKRRMDEEENW